MEARGPHKLETIIIMKGIINNILVSILTKTNHSITKA